LRIVPGRVPAPARIVVGAGVARHACRHRAAFAACRARSGDARSVDLAARTQPRDPYPYRRADRGSAGFLGIRGARPVQWLFEHADVDARWCLVHATHLDDSEMRAIAKSGAVAGLCPTTEANLGDGLFPLANYLDAEGTLGVGSDSHISVSPVEELRWLEYGQRLATRHRNIAARKPGASVGETLWAAALRGGRQAAGL